MFVGAGREVAIRWVAGICAGVALSNTQRGGHGDRGQRQREEDGARAAQVSAEGGDGHRDVSSHHP